MPNRIIKESICTSETIDSLSWLEEVFFYRLIVNCDDYGRMDARPAILKARLFPLKDITQKQIGEALNKLTMAGMVMVYEYDQRPYLQLVSWSKHQQIRNKKSKYPSPDDTCNQMISDDVNCPRNPIQSNPNTNTNTNPKGHDGDGDNPYKFYSENIGPMLPMVAELIQQYEDKLPSDLLVEGMKIAVKQNARKIQYIEKIWQNWLKDDIKNMTDYQRHEAEWENKRVNNGSQPSDPSKREYTEVEAKVAAGYIMRSLEEFLKEGRKTKDDIQQFIDSDRFAYDPPLKTMALELLRSEGVVA